jgi:hypothetical protein
MVPHVTSEQTMHYSKAAAVFVIASQPGPTPRYKVDMIFEIQSCTEGLPPDQIGINQKPV